MPQPDPIDELVRQSINSAPGASQGLAGRVRMRAQAEIAQRRKARLAWVRAGVSVAAAALVVAFVLVYVDFTPPAQPETASGNDTAPRPENEPGKPSPAPDRPAPRPDDPAPENEPWPDLPPAPPQPEPTPQPQPGPEPKPEPGQKGEVIETPKAEPETKPGPEPKPTEAPKPVEKVLLATVPAGAKLRIMEGGDWRDAAEGQAIHAGTRLQARRGYSDLQLIGGELLRFDGECVLGVQGESLLAELADKSLYADNMGLARRLLVRCNGHEASLAGAGVFGAVTGGMSAGCLEGELMLDGEAVARGTERRAAARGLQRPREYKPDALVTAAPARVIARYEMDAGTDMYREGERVEDGVAISDDKPWYIGFRHAPTLAVLPGMRVRMRYRCTGVTRLELEQFLSDGSMFKHVFTPGRDGQWQDLELKLAEIPGREDPQRHLQPGELLRNFKVHHDAGKLEIERVEFVRVQD